MKRAFSASSITIVVLLACAAGCRSGRTNVSSADSQRRFGVRMAKMNLWREAQFRFKRAVDIDPKDAMAHNNLAVAYEANGDFEDALKEYREALRLDRGNQYIQKNYSRFVEFTTKSKKKPSTTRTAGGTTLTGPTTSTSGMTAPNAAPPSAPSTPAAPNAGPLEPAPPPSSIPSPSNPPSTSTNPPLGDLR
jgi:hypothetical protein